MKLLPHQEEMIKNIESGFPKGRLVTIGAINSPDIKGAVLYETMEKLLKDKKLVEIDLSNRESLSGILGAIRERAKQGSVEDQTFLNSLGPRGKIDKEDADMFAAPINAPMFNEFLHPAKGRNKS